MFHSTQLYRPLRLRLIKLFHRLALIGGGLFLALGFVGLIDTPIFPWDGFSIIGTTLFSIWLLRRDNVHQAGNWVLIGMLWAVMFNMPEYGLNHPNSALMLVCIVVSGLLVGGYFQGMMIVLVGLFVPIWAYAEVTGRTTPLVAIQTVEQAVYSTIFWLTVIAVTSGLVWVFARQLEQAVIDSQGKALALAQTNSLLDSQIDLQAFAGRVLTTAAQPLAAERAWLFWDEKRPLSYHNNALQADDDSYLLSPKDDIWHTLATERQVIAIENSTNDGRLPKRRRLADLGVRAVVLIPILHRQEMIGVLMGGMTQRRRFAADELELAEAIGQQLSLGLLLSEYAEAAQETAVVQERNRMAREMHDVLAQGFTGVIVQLEAAADVLDEDRAAVEAHIGRAQALARSSLQEARRSVRGLRPQPLEEAALPEALRQLVGKMTSGSNAIGTFSCVGKKRPLPAQVENNLFRIGQEGLTNALKHADAQTIALRLEYGLDGVALTIEDDGVGFDTKRPSAGLGLRGIHERTEAIDAQLRLISQPEQGTKIVVRWTDR